MMCRYLVSFRDVSQALFRTCYWTNPENIENTSIQWRHFNPVQDGGSISGIPREEVMFEIFPQHTVIEFAMNGAIPPVFKGYALEK